MCDRTIFGDKFKKRRIRNNICRDLNDSNLIWKMVRSRVDPDLFFVLVGATDDRIAEKAEHMGMELQLKPEFGGAFVPFDRSQKNNFLPCNERPEQPIAIMDPPYQNDQVPVVVGTESEEEERRARERGEDKITRSLFVSSQRQDIVHHLIVDEKYCNNAADVDLGTLLEEGIIEKYFPIHTKEARKVLMQTWGKGFFKKQPLAHIKDYFGESVAMFYAYLGFSTRYLLIASFVGLPIFILWHKFESGWFVTVYSIFLAIWATVFLNFWKRKQAEFNFRWNMIDFELNEPTRPAFLGQDRKGFEQDGIWVSFEDDQPSAINIKGEDVKKGGREGVIEMEDNILGMKTNKYFSSSKRTFRMALSLVPMTIMGLIVVIVTVAILAFRLWLQKSSIKTFGTYIGAIVNSITIILLNLVYDKVAIMLTNWENHRTQSHYDNWLIIKLFMFQFVNSYTSLFYIAFFKNKTRIFGSDSLLDGCQGGDNKNELAGGCIDELQIQLGTFLVISTLVNQISITILPYILNNWKRFLCFFCRRDQEKIKLPKWEMEYRLVQDEGDMFKYNQLVIQYGYVVLFGAAFPLAPVIALINNLLNVRVYSVQMLKLNNRPNRRGANSIGVWYWILEFLGIVSVITNCALIGFTHPIVYNYVKDAFGVLVVIVVLEHIIILIKIIMEVLIQDIPYNVRKAKIKQDWIEKGVFDRMDSESRKRANHTSDQALLVRMKLTEKANEGMTFNRLANPESNPSSINDNNNHNEDNSSRV